MCTIRQITTEEQTYLSDLSDLLIDAVHQGASAGFVAPLSKEEAAQYWQQVFGSLDQGLLLWVAENNGKVVGTVQLALSPKKNGVHRAEVQKLFVHSSARGKGIASQLMDSLEQTARSMGRSLLVLNTQAGSDAEKVYQHLGWQKVGEIPLFAASPDGTLHATAYYYKQLME
jgi:GNAT superfamily N-acetyltransferase